MLSMLSGHKRYAHIAALRGDGVLPELLDMSKIVGVQGERALCDARSKRSMSTKALYGYGVISIIARRRCLPIRGSSTSTRR